MIWTRRTSEHLERRAAALRRDATPAERRFSRAFRAAFPGRALRSQYVIPPYIVDFYVPDRQLVIEIDGGQHCESAYDRRRDRRLRRRGYTIVRFWNKDIRENIDGCLEYLESYIYFAKSLEEKRRE